MLMEINVNNLSVSNNYFDDKFEYKILKYASYTVEK
jgi:hypothetical protein